MPAWRRTIQGVRKQRSIAPLLLLVFLIWSFKQRDSGADDVNKRDESEDNHAQWEQAEETQSPGENQNDLDTEKQEQSEQNKREEMHISGDIQTHSDSKRHSNRTKKIHRVVWKEPCDLPNCFRPGTDPPLNMDPEAIPQIVMVSFDDAVFEERIKIHEKLFHKKRRNPNGCPISLTYFVSGTDTDYKVVKDLFLNGHEIASHSVTHKMNKKWWETASARRLKQEMKGQRYNLVQKAGIPRSAITGIRSPFLVFGGDEQLNVLQHNGFEYDSTIMASYQEAGGVWPYTLDFILPSMYCTNDKCPEQAHRGLWEIPLNTWLGANGQKCPITNSCQKLRNKNEALTYLKQNFDRAYNGNRAPFGINMQIEWVKSAHIYQAMDEFIRSCLDKGDVYFVTHQQAIEWMRNPQTTKQAIKFKPWRHSCPDP